MVGPADGDRCCYRRLAQYILPLMRKLSRQGFVRAVARLTSHVFQGGIGLPCFASPFGACEKVCLFLKTCAVQAVPAVRAEELWPCCRRLK